MSQNTISEYLNVQRSRYQRRAGKQARSALPDECEAITGLERKHLIKVLGPIAGEGDTRRSHRGRPAKYDAVMAGLRSTAWPTAAAA